MAPVARGWSKLFNGFRPGFSVLSALHTRFFRGGSELASRSATWLPINATLPHRTDPDAALYFEVKHNKLFDERQNKRLHPLVFGM